MSHHTGNGSKSRRKRSSQAQSSGADSPSHPSAGTDGAVAAVTAEPPPAASIAPSPPPPDAEETMPEASAGSAPIAQPALPPFVPDPISILPGELSVQEARPLLGVMPSSMIPMNLRGVDYILGDQASRFSAEDRALVESAWMLGKEAHSHQTREDGDPYFSHCIEVARTLTDICPEPKAIAAALLHDVIEDTPVSYQDLAAKFPAPIAALVNGVTKLNKMDLGSKSELKAESLRKMILAMAQDIRVVIIKLCDRHHNMRTVDALAATRREKLARETLEIYAPLAHMLGMYRIKADLEDLSMRVVYPEEYREIARLVSRKRAEREKIIERVCELIKRHLASRKIPAEVMGRSKHFYSIFQKMHKQERGFEDIYDLLAVRIIVPTVGDCYTAFGVVHSMFKPIPGRVKDYISVPKQNGYQSMHTSVIGLRGERLEIQIRSLRMHQVAEEGVAAHWKYKLGGDFAPRPYDGELGWLRRFTEMLPELQSHEIEPALQREVFADSVFCFTPAGDVLELPQNSTPIDFAYRIHSKLGDSCAGAKINGRMVSLDTKIQNGVTVEIITNKKAHPSPSWLNIAVTPKALSKIRRWLTSQNYDRNVEHGRDMILQALKGSPLKITSHNIDEHIQSIIRNTIFSTPQDLYAKVGFGSYHVARVVGRLQQAAKKSERKPSARPESKGRSAILVDGMSDAITRLAGCCMPAPGDSIIGFITVGRGVTVHRRQCPTMQRYLASHDEEVCGRIVDCEWANKSLKPLQRYHFRWLGRDRVGLMKDVSDIFTAHNVNILRSSSKPVDTETAVVSVLAGMPDGIPLASIEAKLWQIDGVSRVTVTHKDG